MYSEKKKKDDGNNGEVFKKQQHVVAQQYPTGPLGLVTSARAVRYTVHFEK